VYVIMDMMPTGSLPPPRVRAALEETSQQLPLLIADG
jgi:hypothetical protein